MECSENLLGTSNNRAMACYENLLCILYICLTSVDQVESFIYVALTERGHTLGSTKFANLI